MGTVLDDCVGFEYDEKTGDVRLDLVLRNENGRIMASRGTENRYLKAERYVHPAVVPDILVKK